jgi:hypothetical protein
MSEIRIQQIIVPKTVSKPKTSKTEETKEEVLVQAPQVQPKSADEVLDFLSTSAAICGPKGCEEAKSKKTVKVSDHVSPEQAKRISDDVKVFFAGMEKHVERAVKEFNITPQQAQVLTAMQFNKQFDDDDAAIVATGERFIVS